MEREELIRRYNAGERDFVRVNLSGVYLCKTDLFGVNLIRSNLSEANLTKANLTRANLFRADLSGANLTEANLIGVNLSEANLYRANLSKTNLTNANLQGTCLDPQVQVPETDLSCFETEGDYIIGYRTKGSMHKSNTIYEPGKHYVAPWFSICTETSCHPGIYLATLSWLKDEYPFSLYVKLKALKAETLKVGNKYRAKQIWVLEDV